MVDCNAVCGLWWIAVDCGGLRFNPRIVVDSDAIRGLWWILFQSVIAVDSMQSGISSKIHKNLCT